MLNYVSPHVHQKSLDSASTIATFIAREKELDTGHSVVTDHGTLAACKDVYDQSRAAGLQPILGLEAYHRDDDCPILLAANVPRQEETVCVRCGDAWKADDPRCEHDRADGLRRKTFRETWYKYGHLTMHFRKYAAYQAAVRILTKADLHAERHGGERKPIFSWRDLEEIAAGGATFGSSCLIGMVQRHLLTKNSPEMAERYYDRLRSIVGPENWFVEIFPHRARSNWVKSVFLVATSGQKLKYHFEKWVRTDRGEMSALDLAEAWARKGCQHRRLVAVKNRQTWAEVADFELQSVEAIEGFLDNEPCSWAQDGDVQRGCNQFVLELARRRGDRILVSDDSHFAHPEEKPVQDIRLGQHGAWRFAESYHRMGSDEALGILRDTLGIREAEFEGWVENSRQWASGFKDFRFPSAPLLPTAFYPGDTVDRTSELIARHGRMQWDKPEYVRRLAYEISLFSKARVKDSDGNKVELDMLPYFFPIEEICREYAARGELTGPGRGSAAGTLLAYLLGITHADPIRYKLSIDRFLSKDSGKLPDIDQDLPDRSWLLEPGGWMEKRFGACFAQVSTDTLLKLKSSIKDVHRALYGRVHPEIEETTKRIEEPPQGVSDYNYVFGYGDGDSWVPGAIETDPALKAYSQRYPREWALVVKLLGLARNKSRHPCAHIIMNQPVGEVIPMTRVKDHLVTQYTADSVQAVGAVKYDLLGLKALLNLSHAIRWIHERALTKPPEEGLHFDGKFVPKHRLVPLGDRWADIWDLPDDQDVYDDIAAGRTETVFQFNTSGAKKWLRYFNHKAPDGRSIMRDIDGPTIFTALDRPGPLDAYVINPDDGTRHNMLVEYSRRARGLTPSPDIPEVVSKLMPETHGIMVFQEQLQYAYQEITGCSGSEADAFRRDIAKKKMDKILAKYDSFVERGAKLLGSEDGARQVWEMFKTFGQYGFNRSHSLCYSLIGYACAYLKRHFPLEWWTAVLANAEGDEKEKIAEIYWPHVAHLILMPDVQLSGDSFRIEGDRIRAPLRLIVGVGESAHAELIAGRPYSSIEDFVDKISSRRKASAKQATSADGEQKERLGTTSLNRGVVTKLIVTGVMDSLFPAGLATYQKLEAYERALAKSQSALTGKKVQPHTIDTKYLSMDAIARFQRIKQVLPVYSAPLIPLLPPDVVEESGGRQVLALGGDRLVFATRQELSLAESISPLPEPLEVAVAAYVQAARPFTYNSKSERSPGIQEACELVLDMDGGRWSGVYWGRRKSAASIRPGSILALALVRSKEDRGFSIADWWIVREPLADDAAAEKTSSSEPKVYSTKLGAPPDAVDVTRAGPWGNPHSHMEGTKAKSKTMTAEQAVRAFEEGFWSSPMAQRIGELTGKNLACACPPKGGWGAHHLGGYRCHGQVLLRLANPGIGTPAATSNGWNIYSGSMDGDGIAAALTNPTELSFRRGAIRHKYPVTFRGQSWPDAEEAYQAAKGPGIDRDDVMVEIICQKLLLYPHLAGAIRAMGGTPFLRKCRHETGARSASARRWEGVGESSRFIRNLIAAYERAERVAAGLATSPA